MLGSDEVVEGPARSGFGLEGVRGGTGQEKTFSKDRHHGGVVGAKAGVGDSKPESVSFTSGGEFTSQSRIAGDSPAGGHPTDAQTLRSPHCLDGENLHDGGLNGSTQVAQ